MNRSLTALFAAFEAALVVAIGIGISLAPLTIVWAAQFGFQIDWVVFWRASVDIWLVGHGADLAMTLDPALAAGLGLAGADAGFPLTIAAVGFAVLTAILGVRAGRRVAETSHLLLGELVAIGAFAALSLLVTFSAVHPLARPSLLWGALAPTLVFAAAVVVGTLRAHRPTTDATISSLRSRAVAALPAVPPRVRTTIVAAARGGFAAATAVIGSAAVLLGVLLALNYAQVVRLYEALHTEVLGGIALTLAQLAFLPNFVIWVASWLVGPGFAIGTGSAVGPFTTQLGPVPAIPVFGALPEGDLAYGVVGILVPVVSGFLAAALARRGIVRGLHGASPAGWLVATGLGMGVVGGALLGALAAFSAGSAGPGRLVDVGPDPLWVALWAALEIGLAATLGLFAVRRSSADDADRAASTGGTTHETGRETANPSLAEKLLGRFRGGHGSAEPAQAPAGEPAESEQAPAPR